ncbi:MAG: hypothetical protein M0P12_11680 [Paludibacteraceae bacterium]|nr:hypothetical protein [Paludibacteraceae bacterium]
MENPTASTTSILYSKITIKNKLRNNAATNKKNLKQELFQLYTSFLVLLFSLILRLPFGPFLTIELKQFINIRKKGNRKKTVQNPKKRVRLAFQRDSIIKKV